MGDKSLLDKNKCWTQSYYQNWPGGKRDTDWVSNIVPLKYAELYKVIMNCSTLLRRLLYFHKEMTRGGGVTEACVRFLSVVLYFPVCVQHSVLILDREHQWFSSEPLKRSAVSVWQPSCPFITTTITARKGKTHADAVFCVSPWLLCLW